MIGSTISHYRILAKLGEGGMGVVYKAEDTKLDRTVALKFLPSSALSSEEDKNRFVREAKSAAALSHPNIAHIYEIDEVDGQMFIAMEFIDGKTLQDIVQVNGGTPLPLKKVLGYSAQIAEGLQSAHDKGIIHRDIKSANIMITARDQVKIMDFGLAKVGSGKTVTKLGTTVGTAAYMSPEQARGEVVDHRTDIWSMGVVMYEMISGRLPFKNDYEQALVYSILNEEAEPLTSLRTGVPMALEGIVAKAMAKDASMRYQHADEIPADLKAVEVKTSPTTRMPSMSGIPAAGQSLRRGKRYAVYFAGVAILAVAALAWFYFSYNAVGTEQVVRLVVPLPSSQQIDQIDADNVALSPDGRMLVYSAQVGGVVKLYLRMMNSFDAAPIEGTTGGTGPFFSPDGQSIGFFAEGKLKTVPITGGTPQILYDTPAPRGASWGDDGNIVFSPTFSSGLFSISSAGGPAKVLAKPDSLLQERSYRWPQVLPGGKWVLFTIGDRSNPNFYDNARLAVLSLVNGERHVLGVRGDLGYYVNGGYLIVWRDGNLYAAKFDLNTAEVTSQPVPALANVGGDVGSGASYFTVSNTGILAFLPGGQSHDMRLVKVDLQGNVEPLPLPPGPYTYPRVSPDGKKISVTVGLTDGNNDDIWIYDGSTGAFNRFTFDQRSYCGLWTRDGKRIIYSSGSPGSQSFYSKLADGSSSAQLIFAGNGRGLGAPVSVAPDDKELTFDIQGESTDYDIWLLKIGDGDSTIPLFDTPAFESTGEISPDGKWLAYVSNQSGQMEVYVTSFPSLKGKWQISTGGGAGPIWSPDGHGLYYESTNNTEMLFVPVRTTPDFSIGKPRVLFGTAQAYSPSNPTETFDIYPDGKHFIVVEQSEEGAGPAAINVVLNWAKEVKQKFLEQK